MISGTAQAVFNDGTINTYSLFGDALMTPGAGSLFGSSFESNYSLTEFEYLGSRSVLEGSKSLDQVGRETLTGTLFGSKTNLFSKYLSDPASKTLGEMTLEFSNQMGSYGTQKALNENAEKK